THRQPDALVVIDSAPEGWGLSQTRANVQSHQHQQRAREEGQAPAVGKKLCLRELITQEQKDPGRTQEAQGRTQLGKHSVPRPLAGRGVLRRKQYRSAPLAAETESLADATQREQK